MALIKCPDCGKMFSEYAERCPDCGCPTEDAKAANKEDDFPISQNIEVTAIDEQPSSNVADKLEDESVSQESIQPSTGDDEDIVEEKNTIRKWLWCVGIVAVIVIGFIIAYHFFGSQKNDNGIVQSDSSQVERPKEYLSTDWATFELYGRVKSVIYNFDHPIEIQFDDYGHVKTITCDGEKAKIERIATGKITSILWEGEGWYHLFKYAYNNADFTYSPVPTNYTYTNKISGNDQTYILDYDDDNNLESIERITYYHGEAVETETYEVTINEKDSHGNWIKRTCPYGDEVKVITRNIVYYPDNSDGDAFTEPRTYFYGVEVDNVEDQPYSITITFTPQSSVRIKYEVQDIDEWEGTYTTDGKNVTMNVQNVYDSARKEVVTAMLEGDKLVLDNNNVCGIFLLKRNGVSGKGDEEQQIFGRVQYIFQNLPNHKSIEEVDNTVFTPSFLTVLEKSNGYRDMLAASDGEELAFESAFFWYQGNEIDPDGKLIRISVTKIENNTAYVKVIYKNYEPKEHTMKLILVNGQWCCDEWDDKKESLSKECERIENKYVAQ